MTLCPLKVKTVPLWSSCDYNGSEWLKVWKCYSPDESMESSFTFYSCSSQLILVRSGRTKDKVKMDCTSLQPSWSWSKGYRWGPIAWSSPFTKDKENHSLLTWAQYDCHKDERVEVRQRDWVCFTLVHWPATSW
jgi:hypothetical protein